MATPVYHSLLVYGVKRRFGATVARFCLTAGLVSALLIATVAEAQTTGKGRSARSRPTSTARRDTTLASYVSGYVGEGSASATAQPAPATVPAAPAPVVPPSEPAPGLSYEPAGPEVAGPVAPGGGYNGWGACAGGECWDDEGGWGAGDCYGGECYPLFRPLRDRVWFRGDYLMWWLKGYHVPPLVTTSTTASDLGIIGRPSTHVLFGNETLSGETRSGGRFTLGTWLDACQDVGFEVTYTIISEKTTGFDSGLTSSSILARPFFDSGTGVQSSWLLAQPGQLRGWAKVDVSSRFDSLEALFRRHIYDDCEHGMDVLLGYRYANLEDDLAITDHRQRLSGGSEPVGTEIDQSDWFRTSNSFHGVEFGFVNQVRYNRWSLDLLTKLALGVTRSQVNIDGRTVTTYDGDSHVSDSGLLVQRGTNAGFYKHDNFTVIPELGLTVGYNFTDHLRGTIGYNFLYWSKIVRPGEQIDFNVNLPDQNDQPPTGAQQPAAEFKTNDFWAQGINFGFEYDF